MTIRFAVSQSCWQACLHVGARAISCALYFAAATAAWGQAAAGSAAPLPHSETSSPRGTEAGSAVGESDLVGHRLTLDGRKRLPWDKRNWPVGWRLTKPPLDVESDWMAMRQGTRERVYALIASRRSVEEKALAIALTKQMFSAEAEVVDAVALTRAEALAVGQGRMTVSIACTPIEESKPADKVIALVWAPKHPKRLPECGSNGIHRKHRVFQLTNPENKLHELSAEESARVTCGYSPFPCID
jgi:hypothetical protein